MNKISGRLAALTMAATVALPLGATGLRPFELGARAASLGGAFVARADDASAVYYNPAGMAFLPGLRLKVSIQAADQSLTARAGDGGGESTSRLRPVRTSAFLSSTFKERVSLGLGVFPGQALDVRWPNYWPYNQSVNQNTFFVLAFRGAAAVRVLDSLSLGVGLDFLEAEHTWTWNTQASELDFFPYYSWTNSLVELKGSGLTFSAGVVFAPGKSFRVGARYQHGASLRLEGEHFLKGIGVQRAGLRVELPAEATAGVLFRPVPGLALQLDAQWTEWSRTSPWTLVLGKQVSGAWGTVIPEGERIVSSRWRDTLAVMCGAEYALSSVLFVRAGYSRLPAAVPAAELHPFAPDLNDDVFSVGLGYEGPFFSISTAERLGDMSVDVCLQFHRPAVAVSGLTGYPLEFTSGVLTAAVSLGFIY